MQQHVKKPQIQIVKSTFDLKSEHQALKSSRTNDKSIPSFWKKSGINIQKFCLQQRNHRNKSSKKQQNTDELKKHKSRSLLENYFKKKQLQEQLRETDDTTNFKKQILTIKDFKKLGSLGSGKYSRVIMVKHKKIGFICAMKIIQKKYNQNKNSNYILQLIHQIKLQSYMQHKNIIELYSIFTDQDNVYLLMQLGCDGQLYDLMKKKIYFNQETVSFIMRHILNGINYMHNKHIIHRDIKPENIVLVHGCVKLCDFGWSVYTRPNQLRSTFCGTPLYLSPEVLQGNQYDAKVDIWALGTLGYQLFTAQNPFKINSKSQLSKAITQDFKMNFGSKQFKIFLYSILKKKPHQRPNANSLLKHEFILKYQQLETAESLCL